ncbi:outer membrane beta-barrel protein [Tropicimonas marinistellae]|uniref:outer membrane beta-barrel protein n=1 Tax=Tropicimonas marinistellae TaxID=1739787 RepID=UPI0008362564|nr:outer membrane beta-barrel protein [Tropicimonas marinistellae]
MAMSAACFAQSAGPAAAELVLSFYLGANASPDSTVEYDFKEGAGAQSTEVSWDGEALKMPPYFGVRATWWFDTRPNWGVAFDNVHAKIAADPMPEGFSALEFTDGVNMYTGNVQYRWLNDSRFTPYAGVGVGFTTPHVEVRTEGGSSDTFEYQFGGAAAQALVGVDYRINDRWSAFGEAKLAKFWLDVDLENDGWLETDVVSRQIAFGVNYTLGRR